MSEIDWSILTGSQPKAADPLAALESGARQRAYTQQADLNNRKFAATQAADARQQAAYQAAGAAWQNGDTRTAQAALLGAGANDLLGTVNTADNQAFEQHQKGQKAIADMADYIKEHIPLEHRADYIRHLAPWFQGAGAHPDDIENVASDPSDDVLTGVSKSFYDVKDQAAAANQVVQTAVNQQNADTQRMTEQRLEQTPVGIATTDNVYLPGGMAAPGATTAPAGSAAPASSAPITVRNNNPGALRPDGRSNWQGATGTAGGFLVFDSPENGRRAQVINIQNQARLHGINTVADLVTKYAPSSDGNNPAAYAATVAQAIGVGVHDPVNFADPTVAAKVADVMGRVESGGSPARAQAQPAPQAGVRGPTLLAAGVPKVDQNAVDANDPAVEFAAQQYAATGDMPALGQGQGPLRHAILTRAAQIAQERHYTPAQIASNKAQVRASTQALAQDSKNFDTIQGAEATAIANGQRYVTLADEQPGNTSWVSYNRARNALGGEFSDKRVTDARTAYNTFIGEYTKVVNSSPTGAGTMSDSARHEAMDSFETATSPAARRAQFDVMVADMASRRKAQQDIIDRRKQEIANVGRPPSQASVSTAGVVHVSNAADYHKLASGTVYIDPTGHKRTKP